MSLLFRGFRVLVHPVLVHPVLAHPVLVRALHRRAHARRFWGAFRPAYAARASGTC
jgi:hypothetical protein